MKDYMASGSFARGRDSVAASASMVFVGNINQPVDTLVKTSHLLAPFPEAMIDSAFFDRFHGYIPGWEIPKMRPEFFTNQYGLIVDYFAEWVREMRKRNFGDAYEAYVHIEKRTDGRIVHASCNLHARREFVKPETYEPTLCAEAATLYRHLYAIEERGKLLSVAELRQREAVPIWSEIERWFRSDRVQRAALPSSRFGKAVGYLRNQWSALQRYLTDGRLPIDNNQAEQVIRPLAIDRRNWLFFGHPQAATGRLQLMSVVSSAHRHHLVVEDYLADILEKLADATQNTPALLKPDSEYLAELLPDRWAIAHPKSIRKQRIAEKTDRSDAKRVRRARLRAKARRAKNNAANRA